MDDGERMVRRFGNSKRILSAVDDMVADETEWLRVQLAAERAFLAGVLADLKKESGEWGVRLLAAACSMSNSVVFARG